MEVMYVSGVILGTGFNSEKDRGICVLMGYTCVLCISYSGSHSDL